MKLLLSIFIIFTIALRPVLPLIDYVVNYDFIVSKLCENKNKPEIMCNGKCYLSKELTNNNQSSNKTETTKVVTNILDSFVNNNVFELTKLELFETEKNNKTVFTSDLYLFFFSKDIFHPPLV